MKTRTTLFVAACLASASSNAYAQAGAVGPAVPNASAANDEQDPVQGIQDIVVTAQRREENAQKAAIPLSVISSDDLIRAGVTDVNQITNAVPSLQVGTLTGPYSSFYLRGVGNFATTPLADPAIAFSVDGVFYARPSSTSGVYYDLERIEVLKGPQGTLYGRNSTGGAINVISRAPELGRYDGYAMAEYGNYDAVRGQAALNLPLGDTAAVRVAGFISRSDGVYSDGTGDNDGEGVRATLRVEASPSVRLTVGADYSHQGGVGPGATFRQLISKDERIGVLDPRAGALRQATFVRSAGDVLPPLNASPFLDNSYWGVRIQADIDTSLGVLTILPAYRRSSLDLLSAAAGIVHRQKETDEQFSGEVRLSSNPGGRLQYTLGFYAMHEAIKAQAYFAQTYFGGAFDQNSSTDTYAPFGRMTYSVTDRFRINVGARYTIERKNIGLGNTAANILCFRPTGCPGATVFPDDRDEFLALVAGRPPIPTPIGTAGSQVLATRTRLDTSKTFRRATYRVGVEYDAAPRSLLYATFETGFKSGGFFASIDDPVYRPETIQAFTVGSKNRFFDNRLQLNVEGFYWTYKDQQISSFRTNSVGGIEFATQNVGRVRNFGAEIDAQYRLDEHTLLKANVQYLNAKNTEFVFTTSNLSPPGAPPSTPATGCPAALSADQRVFVVNCSGYSPVNAPEWSLMLGAEREFQLGDRGKLILSAQTRYQTKVFTSTEYLASQIQDAYWMSDAQIEYRSANDRFSLAFFMNNIENTQAMSQSRPHPQNFNLVAVSLRQPRTYGVRLRVTM